MGHGGGPGAAGSRARAARRALGAFKIGDEKFYRRLDHWLRRYPDVEVEVASTRFER